MNRFLIIVSSFIITLVIILSFSTNTSKEGIIKTDLSPFAHLKKDTNQNPEKILFFGDMMLDRNVSSRMDKFGMDYPFKEIKDLLLDSELVVVNLEGVFTDNDSVTKNNSGILRFTFDKKLIPILKDFNFKIFSQANNHTNDFGLAGANESKSVLSDNQMFVFGDFFNENDELVTLHTNDIDIILIGFNEFSYKNKEKINNLIRSNKTDSNRVVVMSHWGIEYDKKSNYNQQSIAHEFIDSGADIIIGAHPHVVQELELYKGKLIIYSLGNFIFDQDFSKETTEGLATRIIFSTDYTSIDLIPFNIIKSQAIVKDEEEKNIFLEELSARSVSEINSQIRAGKIYLENK